MITQADLSRFVYETGSPFRRLDALLTDVPSNPDLSPINMTVGGPRHAPPEGIAEAITGAADGFTKYPPINGTAAYRKEIADWLIRRYALDAGQLDADTMVLPLNGSREGLALAALCARDLLGANGAKDRPVVVMQNPFYQAYPIAALMAGAEVVLLDGDTQPPTELAPDILARTVAVFLASPTNPQGRVLTDADWNTWIESARSNGFYLFADECYSEIYRRDPPPGALEIALKSTGSAANVVCFNSLSKRSNLPGLRTGFAAGCPAFMAAFMRLRLMGGPQVPLPLLSAAAHAWRDEAHVESSRALYQEKWGLVETELADLVDEPLPDAGFFLWLKLPSTLTDVDAACTLWKDYALRTIPGSFMTYPIANRPRGTDRLRLALVDDLQTTSEALKRLRAFFEASAANAASQTRHAHKGH